MHPTYQDRSAVFAMIDGMTEYTYRAEWCPDFGGYLRLCLELRNVWERALTPHEAIAAAERRVAEEVAADVT